MYKEQVSVILLVDDVDDDYYYNHYEFYCSIIVLQVFICLKIFSFGRTKYKHYMKGTDG